MTYPERFIVSHPFNPATLIPLVEVVAGEKTNPKLKERAKAFYSYGKEVIIPKREATGHIANRLNAALYREVVHVGSNRYCHRQRRYRSLYSPRSWPSLGVLGPNLVYHLGGGDGGYAHYLDHLGPSQETRWKDLGVAATGDENEGKTDQWPDGNSWRGVNERSAGKNETQRSWLLKLKKIWMDQRHRLLTCY